MPKGLNRKVLFLRDVSGTRGAPEGKSSPIPPKRRVGFFVPIGSADPSRGNRLVDTSVTSHSRAASPL